MKLNNFLVLAEDLLTLLKKDEDLWFEIWEAERARLGLQKQIKTIVGKLQVTINDSSPTTNL